VALVEARIGLLQGAVLDADGGGLGGGHGGASSVAQSAKTSLLW
jgi:hypothetical protein